MATEPPFQVAKYASNIPVSEATQLGRLLANPVLLGQRLAEGVDRVMNATPGQRAQWAAERKRHEATEATARAEQRASTPVTELTLDALIARMGWSWEYAEHLVQPYCECKDDIDGWSYCQHARDLGLAP